tara:strand:+ start:232 stop:837 length:606 start_codon:yes stop_codon:yes gene_type:complete
MSEIRVVKKFVSPSQLNILNEWSIKNYKSDFFKSIYMYHSVHRDKTVKDTHFSTRLCTARNKDHLFEYPEECYLIQDRLKNKFKLDKVAPIGKNGIVTGVGIHGDVICEHRDPQWEEGRFTVHFNLLSQKPLSGGITIVDNCSYNIDVGDMLIYNVQSLKHRVTQVKGDVKRIMWVFGFCVTSEQLKIIFDFFNMKRWLNL